MTECLVGQLTNAVFAGTEPPVDEFNWLVGSALTGVRPGATAPAITREQLRMMMQMLHGLLARWRPLPPGETLELDFPDA